LLNLFAIYQGYLTWIYVGYVSQSLAEYVRAVRALQ